MQATVASYDDSSRSGSVVTDEGKTFGFTGAALAEHIRHLRPGQRVHVQADGTNVVTDIRIWR